MSTNIYSFDIDEFIKFNFDNGAHSLKVLRDQNYWYHFDILINFYRDLLNANDPTVSSSHLKMAWMHFVSGCNVNLIKGTSSVISGHLTDSSIYVRRTIESVRYSAFLREKPDTAQLWFSFDGKDEFESKYKKWWDPAGRTLVDAEMENSNFHFKHASNYGPHANAQLFFYLHAVSYKEQTMDFRTNYHEIEPNERGYHSLLALYFWHLRIHSKCIDWWLKKSGFITHLTSDQLRYWTDCNKTIEADDIRVKELLKNGPLGRET